MPSIRHTDRGRAARACPRCGGTHRAKTIHDDPIPCPPANRWLVGGGVAVQQPKEEPQRG